MLLNVGVLFRLEGKVVMWQGKPSQVETAFSARDGSKCMHLYGGKKYVDVCGKISPALGSRIFLRHCKRTKLGAVEAPLKHQLTRERTQCQAH